MVNNQMIPKLNNSSMDTTSLQNLLDAFLEKWHIDIVRNMSLEEYVDIENPDTFCQWVETKTKRLGSINGMPSIKFGIYKRNDPNNKPKNYKHDQEYSWIKGYGQDRFIAFKNIKSDIIRIIEYAQKGNFEKINEIKPLPDIYKWKVAFLYSNEKLIPIFKREILFKIAAHFGLSLDKQTSISDIQDLMIANKPTMMDVYQFMKELYERFGKGDNDIEIHTTSQHNQNSGLRIRKASIHLNTQTQNRIFLKKSYIAEQKHGIIQEKLKSQLISQYGSDNVFLEKNFVDITLNQPDYIGIYEIKTDSYASKCIKNALGQLLLYSHNNTSSIPKKLFVVGQYPPTKQDNAFITYVKHNLNIDFIYLHIDI